MPAYEPPSWGVKRQQQAAREWEDFSYASPDDVLQVDAVRDARGGLPSQFGQDMTRVAAGLASQREADRRRKMNEAAIAARTTAPQAQPPGGRWRELRDTVSRIGEYAKTEGYFREVDRGSVRGPMQPYQYQQIGRSVAPVTPEQSDDGYNTAIMELQARGTPDAIREVGRLQYQRSKGVPFSQAQYGEDLSLGAFALTGARIAAKGLELLDTPVYDSNPVVAELTRPTNYIASIRGLSFAPRAALPIRLGAEMVASGLGRGAAEEVYERTENPLLAGAAGIGAGVAGGIGAARLGTRWAAQGYPVGMSIREVGEEGAEGVARQAEAAQPSPRTFQSEAAQRYIRAQESAEAPVSTGIVDALEQASAAVRTDPQGAVSRLAGRVPGLRNIRNWDRPGLEMQRNILEGHIAKRGVESRLLTEQGTRRYDVLRVIDDAFGEGATRGERVLDAARVNVDDLHTFKGKPYPASGTAYDALQRPYAYNLTPQQQQALRAWAEADEGLRVRLNDEFGGDVGQFVPERGGVYVQNINKSAARQAQLEELARTEGRTITGTGKSKPRVWDSGFDRWRNNVERGLPDDRVFVPETDLNVLGYTSDLSKANAAGDLTFRAAVGGKTISEVKEEVAPRLVNLRQQLRTDIDSIRGRIQRAEQSAGREAAVARSLESQAEQTARQADSLVGRDPVEAFEEAIAELDQRAFRLSEAARGPAGRVDLARQGIESLRDNLASLKDQYAEVKRAYDAVDPQDYVQVRSLPGRYFPTKEAAQIEELSRPAKDNVVTRTLEGWRSQVLAGDIGPLTGIQGLIMALSGRAGVTRAVIGSLADSARTGDLFRPFRTEVMQQFLRDNVEAVQQFSFATGRNVGGRLPAEIGQGGLLARIPGFVDANEAMFNIITRRQIEMFTRVRDDLVKAGYSLDEAVAAAGDLTSKVNPLMTTARLGQSSATAQEQRFLPTSLGFIRQPLALTEEAFTTYARMAAGQKVTPRQKLAASIYAQFIGNLMAVSVASAAVNAIAKGDDVEGAIQDALDPESRAFLGMSIGDQRLPMANPFRAPLRVGLNSLRNILNVGVEPLTGRDISASAGDSVVDYATGRLGPPARSILEAGTELTAAPWEREYQGDNDILRLLSAGSMLASGAAPIPARGIGEEIKSQYDKGEFDPGRLVATAVAETSSFSLIPQESRKMLDSKSEASFDAPFSDLDREQRRTILLGNPDLVKTARDDVKARMDESGFKDISDRAWNEMSQAFGVTQSYDEYRARLRNELEQAGAERTMIDRALRDDPLIKAYQEIRRGFEYEWIAENVGGLAVEAYDFGLIPDNDAIRRMIAGGSAR